LFLLLPRYAPAYYRTEFDGQRAQFLVSAKLQAGNQKQKTYNQPFYVHVILLEGKNE
jgi:hypothetical protein